MFIKTQRGKFMNLWRTTISAEPKNEQSPEPTPLEESHKKHDFVPLTLLFLYGQPARFTHRTFLLTQAK